MKIVEEEFHVIMADDVSHGLAQGIEYLRNYGVRETSRNGPVYVAKGPVLTIYKNPWKRVLFSQTRDANPFFHFMEAMWMLAGRNDLEFPKKFNKRFGEYSDDGVTVPAAYGHRWRNYFGYDQLPLIIDELRKNPDSRRAVLTMWDGGAGDYHGQSMMPDYPGDLQRLELGSKDIPCNTQAYFDLRGGVLNMTVTCRSNDIIWGAYGANAVHFSFLLEYMAAWLGVPMGVYRQFSNNFHVYPEVYGAEKLDKIMYECGQGSVYDADYMVQLGIEAGWPGQENFDASVAHFLNYPEGAALNDVAIIREVAIPMYAAWKHHKSGDYLLALQNAALIMSYDWRIACMEWLGRRLLAKQAKEIS